jgi:hypothetical protein
MYSGDGEYVHFSNKVVLEGSVEHWLGKVEGEMRVTLRTQMGLCKVAHKKTKRDLWIKTWAGQLIIAISQLTWTGDTISAINGGRCVRPCATAVCPSLNILLSNGLSLPPTGPFQPYLQFISPTLP